MSTERDDLAALQKKASQATVIAGDLRERAAREDERAAGYRKQLGHDEPLSTERDELADIIASNRNEYADKTASRVLAAGYRKPYRVTAAEELDALPFESVIRDAQGHVLERWGGPNENVWGTVMVSNFINRDDITLPATVLYVGCVL